MGKWPNGEWSNRGVTKWGNDQIGKWPNGGVIKWGSDQMGEWPNEEMTKWGSDQMGEWSNGGVTKWGVTKWGSDLSLVWFVWNDLRGIGRAVAFIGMIEFWMGKLVLMWGSSLAWAKFGIRGSGVGRRRAWIEGLSGAEYPELSGSGNRIIGPQICEWDPHNFFFGIILRNIPV